MRLHSTCWIDDDFGSRITADALAALIARRAGYGGRSAGLGSSAVPAAKGGGSVLVACLWSHWTDPTGKEPDLLSFAAITDDPEPEVAAAGHDQTIINIKPEHVDAWLNPQGDTAAMQAIFDDKRHPYYEHREAA